MSKNGAKGRFPSVAFGTKAITHHFRLRRLRKFDGVVDGSTFEEVTRGQLKRIEAWQVEAFPFESFEFPPTKARFVRMAKLSSLHVAAHLRTRDGNLVLGHASKRNWEVMMFSQKSSNPPSIPIPSTNKSWEACTLNGNWMQQGRPSPLSGSFLVTRTANAFSSRCNPNHSVERRIARCVQSGVMNGRQH